MNWFRKKKKTQTRSVQPIRRDESGSHTFDVDPFPIFGNYSGGTQYRPDTSSYESPSRHEDSGYSSYDSGYSGGSGSGGYSSSSDSGSSSCGSGGGGE